MSGGSSSSFFKALTAAQNADSVPAAQYTARPSVNPYTSAYTPNRGAPQQNTPQMTNPYVMQRQINNPYIQNQVISPYRVQQQPQMPRSTTPNNIPQFGTQQIIDYLAQARTQRDLPQSTPNLYRPNIDTSNLGRVLPMYVPPPPAPPAPPGSDGSTGGDGGDGGGGGGNDDGTSNASTDATDADAAAAAAEAAADANSADADASSSDASDSGNSDGVGDAGSGTDGAGGTDGSGGDDGGGGDDGASGGLIPLKKHLAARKKINKATGGLLDLKNNINLYESKMPKTSAASKKIMALKKRLAQIESKRK